MRSNKDKIHLDGPYLVQMQQAAQDKRVPM